MSIQPVPIKSGLKSDPNLGRDSLIVYGPNGEMQMNPVAVIAPLSNPTGAPAALISSTPSTFTPYAMGD